MIADRHYWRTADGRLVETGHLDAEILAYPAGSEIPDDVAQELIAAATDPERESDSEPDPEPPRKQARPAANKARAKPADK